MTSNLISAILTQQAVRVTFVAFGKTLSIEVQDVVPEQHLQQLARQHLGNLIWDKVFERYVTELSAEATDAILKCRNERVGGSE
jgi:hypothetical protein